MFQELLAELKSTEMQSIQTSGAVNITELDGKLAGNQKKPSKVISVFSLYQHVYVQMTSHNKIQYPVILGKTTIIQEATYKLKILLKKY